MITVSTSLSLNLWPPRFCFTAGKDGGPSATNSPRKVTEVFNYEIILHVNFWYTSSQSTYVVISYPVCIQGMQNLILDSNCWR